MPATNQIINIFLGKKTIIIKPVSARVDPADLKLVQEVFPEAGFTSYLTALVYRKLADELRERAVTNVGERHLIPEFISMVDFRDSLTFIIDNHE